MSQRYLTGAYDDTWNPGTYAFWDIDPIVVNYKGTMIVLHVFFLGGIGKKKKKILLNTLLLLASSHPLEWDSSFDADFSH